MPTPITFLLPLNQTGAYPARNLPITAARISNPPISKVGAIAWFEGIEHTDIDRCPHRHEEERDKEMAEMRHAPLNLMGVWCIAEQEARRKGPDNHGGPDDGRQPRQAEGEHDREHRRGAGQINATHRTDEGRDEQPSHQQRSCQEAEGNRGCRCHAEDGERVPSREARDHGENDEANHIINDGRAKDNMAFRLL